MNIFNLLSQYSYWGLYVLQLAIAVIFLRHGLPKLKNIKSWFFVVGLVETISSLFLILGIYIQIASLGLAIIMLGAIYTKIFKWHIPFSSQKTTGWELDLVLLAANLAVIITGGSLGIF